MNRKKPMVPWKVLDLGEATKKEGVHTMELTDIHHRRSNIAIVADDCKANNYPLIAWPEDKELLRLSDLPKFCNANQRANWTGLEHAGFHVVTSDLDLRNVIQEGFAYSINPSVQQLTSAFVVQSWQVTSR